MDDLIIKKTAHRLPRPGDRMDPFVNNGWGMRGPGPVRDYFINKLVAPLGYIYFDTDNLLPQRLINLALSPTHSTILLMKKNYMVGTGLGCTELGDEIGVDKFLANSWANENIYQVLQKCTYDYVMFGGFAISVTWAKDRENIAAIEHVPFASVRITMPQGVDSKVDSYYISSDWRYWSSKKEATPFLVPAFDPEKREGEQLLYVTDYTTNNDWYPYPTYYGAIYDIANEYSITQYLGAYVRNGMLLKHVIIMPKMNDPAKTIERENKFAFEFNGPDNANRPMFIYAEPDATTGELKSGTIDVKELSASEGSSKMLSEIQAQCVRNICTTHGIPPVLLGNQSSGLSVSGNSEEMRMAFDMVFNNQIKPAQAFLIKPFNDLLNLNEYKGTLYIKNPVRIDLMTENIIGQTLTVNEVRAANNLPPVPGGDVIISQQAKNSDPLNVNAK